MTLCQHLIELIDKDDTGIKVFVNFPRGSCDSDRHTLHSRCFPSRVRVREPSFQGTQSRFRTDFAPSLTANVASVVAECAPQVREGSVGFGNFHAVDLDKRERVHILNVGDRMEDDRQPEFRRTL